MKNLDASQIELSGKHLIEASAGTGKTHNITRIFLRLLLERDLAVEQILVMTFTKDATEEIRGRIDSFIRECLHEWDQLIKTDPYFKSIAKNLASKGVDSRHVKARLTQALLYIDDAAIFTIHGFCKRVLNQYAFSSGVSFNAQMEADTQEFTIEACQDWFRLLALKDITLTEADANLLKVNQIGGGSHFDLVTEFWPEPLAFIKQFNKALTTENILRVQSPKTIVSHFDAVVEEAISSLKSNHEVISQALINVKKGADKATREQELNNLLTWLTALKDNAFTQQHKMPDSFIDGRRFARSKYKAELVDAFLPVNAVKKQFPMLVKKVNRAIALIIVRAGIAHIRTQIKRKKQKSAVMGFDDLISTLNNCLATEPERQLAQYIFEQFPVALIDEFQDTDPQQFAILKAIYYHQKNSALYMIGDPKQAIYGFRGGDVFAYLSARADCDHQWIMDTNWRSSGDMITGYNRLFYGNSLTKEARDVFGYHIPYLPVKPSPNASNKTLSDKRFQALQFIHFDNTEVSLSKGGKSKPAPQSFRATMAQWCAKEIKQLLMGSESNLSAGDIALLVRDGSEAASIKQALAQHGLTSVFMSNRANLLQSYETQQLLQVLKGILFLENDRLYTAALASSLMGFSHHKLMQLQQDDLAWQNMKSHFDILRNEWRYKGFIGMALQLMHEHFCFSTNEINAPDSNRDRVLTNLLHLFELLQSASQRHRQPQELLFWFEQQSQIDNPEIEAELRLESDDNLIRIITQHGSKGMEYPVVFVPFATRHKDPLKFGSQQVCLIEYHDDKGQLQHSLDGHEEEKQRMASEAYAEAIRLLYVAVTRAEKRCYILTTAFEKFEQSPLGCTLKWHKDTNIAEELDLLAKDNPKEIGVSLIEPAEFELFNDIAASTAKDSVICNENTDINLARFNGKIERDWWLSSFSALSKNLRHNGVSAPDRDVQEDTINAEQILPYREMTLPLRFALAKGAHTGNLLHDILEHTDFIQPNWQESSHWPLLKYGEIAPQVGETQEALIQQLHHWLNEVLTTPLTIMSNENSDKSQHNHGLPNAKKTLTLNTIATENTLRETEFYYPMNSARTGALTKLLTEHRNQNINKIGVKKHHVHLPSYQQLKGMMHGFIDLVFEADGKFYVCDYKSSFLGEDFANYQHQDMRHNIEKNHYDLQYLIYALALHRQLTYAKADYDPNIHFGGVYYFYLRGMTSDPTKTGCGVYYRQIPVQELLQLDAIFSGEQT